MSKLIGNELVTLTSETSSTGVPTIITPPHEDHISKLSPSFDKRIEYMNVNRKIKVSNFEPVTTIANPTIHYQQHQH